MTTGRINQVAAFPESSVDVNRQKPGGSGDRSRTSGFRCLGIRFAAAEPPTQAPDAR